MTIKQKIYAAVSDFFLTLAVWTAIYGMRFKRKSEVVAQRLRKISDRLLH